MESPTKVLREKFDFDRAPTTDPNEAISFNYERKGHWKRSLPKYLGDLKKEKVKETGTSSIFLIELHSTSNYNS